MADGIRDRIVELRRVPASTLLPNPKNWRRHPPAQAAALRAMLQEIGMADALLARETPAGLMLIDGHLRAETLPDETVPVLVLDVDEEEAGRLLATLDPLAGMAVADEDALWRLVEEVGISDTGLLAELERLAGHDGPKVGLTDPDAVPAASSEPTTQIGDLWLLGEHRLLCGDSTDHADLERLMNGERAELMATDPPYLVDYDGGNHPPTWANGGKAGKDASKHWDAYVDHESSVRFYQTFLSMALESALAPRVAVYQWYADMRTDVVYEAWREAGLLPHQTVIWVKARKVLTRRQFMQQHEPCLFGWAKGRRPSLHPPADVSSVWGEDMVGEWLNEHPTQKPVALFAGPVLWHTRPGGLMFEPFSGSGTAIIAAEKSGRRCFAMECSPTFVDVAVRRWEDFTGQKAVLDG